ncbi:hydroxypyruvate reductase, partial [Muribaculaceae bacterium Isolate-002 (NCI)]
MPVTPKAGLPRVHTFVIHGLEDACVAAVAAAEREGLVATVLTSFLEGDSRQAGLFLGALAREVRCRQRPVAPPCILIAAGETTVRLEGEAGSGGPSQELALAFAQQVGDLRGIGIAAIETE